MTFMRPTWTLLFLAVYLPFESFILKFIPDEIYFFARFFSEILIYLLALVTIWLVLSGKKKLKQTPVGLPFVLFVVVLIASAAINTVVPTTALLGLRQILRFMIVLFVVVYLNPPKTFIKHLTFVMFGVLIFTAGLGIMQGIIGAPLDNFLLPADARTFGDITLTSGVVQFWDPGSRIFATFGRYDRLGNFLYFFLLMAVGLLYERYIRKERKELLWVFLLGLPALIMTFSRSSWFAFLLGFLFIGIWIHRDKRVITALVTFLIIVVSYLGLTGLNVRYITEAPGQTLVERFYETFSYARWQGEYVGLGRVYWLIQTPTAVIPASPIFGFGPGQFGGGAVSALRNTTAYEKLGLPFGVFGTEGIIDNNWFSLWGESGTLGMIFYFWLYIALFVYAIRLYRRSDDAFTRAIAIGFAAALLGVAFNAFTSTIFEIRTIAFYLWLYAGFVLVLGQREKRKQITK